MARRRTEEPVANLRALLASEWRATARDFGERLGVPAESCGAFMQRADAIDRGEPVLVANWELPRGIHTGSLSREPYWWVVEPNGSVRPEHDPRRN